MSNTKKENKTVGTQSLPVKFAEAQPATQTPKPSKAAALNNFVIAKFQRELARDPEVDLTTLFPFRYQERLANFKAPKDSPLNDETPSPEPEAIPFRLPKGEPEVIHPLSDQVKALLKMEDNTDSPSLQGLAEVVKTNYKNALFCEGTLHSKYVIKCSQDIVLKSKPDHDLTEYTALQYLLTHCPSIPAPRPHGVIFSGGFSYLFMTYIPGITLNKIWSDLSESNKLSLQQNLNDIFQDLRQIPHTPGYPLGGVAGEGCKDTRRHTRLCPSPIYTAEEFWEFQYSTAEKGSMYKRFLIQLTKPHFEKDIKFTHGDLRDENIILKQNEDGRYVVSGIIDWEKGGFYPADFECTKTTLCFSNAQRSDWYLYLPYCISPERYPTKWLADVIWDPFVC